MVEVRVAEDETVNRLRLDVHREPGLPRCQRAVVEDDVGIAVRNQKC